MSTTENNDKPPTTTVEQIITIPWVAYVGKTDRPGSTHVVDLERSSVDVDVHLDLLQEHGLENITISSWGDYGLRLYVRIP